MKPLPLYIILLFLSLGNALWAQEPPREHLNGQMSWNPGDLLFFRDTEGMGAAVKESTGQYTHVAMVESVGDTVLRDDPICVRTRTSNPSPKYTAYRMVPMWIRC